MATHGKYDNDDRHGKDGLTARTARTASVAMTVTMRRAARMRRATKTTRTVGTSTDGGEDRYVKARQSTDKTAPEGKAETARPGKSRQ